MTAPIRSVPELVDALRRRRDELNISHETIDNIAGLQPGYTSKLLAPVPIKNLGQMSLPSILGALGLVLVAVPDPEQVAKVAPRWQKRKRPQRIIASVICAKRDEMPEISKQQEDFALMQIIGRAGGIASGKKRRAKAMRKRELQAKRTHAARTRWSKRRAAT
jgi:hypothetical protein